MRRLIVLRPEPGNAATCRRIAAAGAAAVALPLFVVRAIEWTPPDPARFDALVLTSANAARHAGPALARYADLPVVVVGQATAEAAIEAGLKPVAIGTRDAGEVAALLSAIGARHALHLAGRDHRPVPGAAGVVVYASEAIDVDAARLRGGIALVHSARAGARLAALVTAADRRSLAVAAISPTALDAAGEGWAAAVAAPMPTDAALIAAALSIDPPRGGEDKTA